MGKKVEAEMNRMAATEVEEASAKVVFFVQQSAFNMSSMSIPCRLGRLSVLLLLLLLWLLLLLRSLVVVLVLLLLVGLLVMLERE